MFQLELTPNQTLFEYDDSIDTDNLIVYHPEYIRIDEIDLYQQFLYETIDVNQQQDVNQLCNQLYQTIHDINFRWITNGDLGYNYPSIIMSKIISRLRCISDDYNGYIYFANLHLRGNWDSDEYQTNLANYIINEFIRVIGENQTIILFAKHFGNIIRYLFYS